MTCCADTAADGFAACALFGNGENSVVGLRCGDNRRADLVFLLLHFCRFINFGVGTYSPSTRRFGVIGKDRRFHLALSYGPSPQSSDRRERRRGVHCLTNVLFFHRHVFVTLEMAKGGVLGSVSPSLSIHRWKAASPGPSRA